MMTHPHITNFEKKLIQSSMMTHLRAFHAPIIILLTQAKLQVAHTEELVICMGLPSPAATPPPLHTYDHLNF
jgi:hypothetical protein